MLTSVKPVEVAPAPDAEKTGARSGGNPSTSPDGSPMISSLDVQLVQNLVERCLQLYMNQREVVTLLQQQTKIEPSFTALVWQKLEEQNPEFFKAYYARLRLKDQIFIFNQMLERQYHVVGGQNGGGADIGRSVEFRNHLSPATYGEGRGERAPELGVPMANMPSRYESGAVPMATMATPMPTGTGRDGGSALEGDNHNNQPPETHSKVPGVFENSFQPTPGETDHHVSLFGGHGFFPRNFSLSDLSVDLLQTPGSDDMTNEQNFNITGNEEETIGLKRNFSELSDL